MSGFPFVELCLTSRTNGRPERTLCLPRRSRRKTLEKKIISYLADRGNWKRRTNGNNFGNNYFKGLVSPRRTRVVIWELAWRGSTSRAVCPVNFPETPSECPVRECLQTTNLSPFFNSHKKKTSLDKDTSSSFASNAFKAIKSKHNIPGIWT